MVKPSSNSPVKILSERNFSANQINPSETIKRLSQVTIDNIIHSEPNTGNQLDNYRLERVIGQGSYAVVRLATDKTNATRVAIKTYEKQRLMDPRKMKNVRREISILKDTDHENIIKLLTTIETPKQVLFYM